MDKPGYRLHRLKGDKAGLWAVNVSGNWRIVFKFEDGGSSISCFQTSAAAVAFCISLSSACGFPNKKEKMLFFSLFPDCFCQFPPSSDAALFWLPSSAYRFLLQNTYKKMWNIVRILLIRKI